MEEQRWESNKKVLQKHKIKEYNTLKLPETGCHGEDPWKGQLPFSKMLLTFQDSEGDRHVSTSSGEDGREGEQAQPPARELKRGNLCCNAVRAVRRSSTPSRCPKIWFSKTKICCGAQKNFCGGMGKDCHHNKSSKTALSGKFHLGPLRKNDTKSQEYVKQEKETKEALLTQQGPSSWHLGGALPDSPCAPTSFPWFPKCLPAQELGEQCSSPQASSGLSQVQQRRGSDAFLEWRGRGSQRGREELAFNNAKDWRGKLLTKETQRELSPRPEIEHRHMLGFLLTSWGLFILLFLGLKSIAFSPYHKLFWS